MAGNASLIVTGSAPQAERSPVSVHRASLAAKQALKDAKAQCKEMVETGMAPGPRDVDAKFKAAREESEGNGVENLTQKDIEGLSSEQLKQLRGY